MDNTQHSEAEVVAKPVDHAKNTKMIFGILSYIGILVLIPLIFKKDDPFVKFHIKQGLVLFCISLLIWIVSSVLGGFGGTLWVIYRILNLGVLALSILGVINVVQNKMKELPLVGHLASYFPI